jgi:NADH dehydrogenase
LQARVLEYAPGKPFSLDNYRSFKAGGVDADDGLAALGIAPASLDSVAPQYLGADNQRGRYNRYRSVGGGFSERQE